MIIGDRIDEDIYASARPAPLLAIIDLKAFLICPASLPEILRQEKSPEQVYARPFWR